MALDLYSMLATWQNIGVFDFVLPFLLIFTLSFAVLSKAKILGDNKNLNIIVSLVLAFFFLQNPFLIASLQNLLPNVSFAVVIGLMFLLLVGVLLGDRMGDWYTSASLKWATGISIAVIIWAIFSRPGFDFTNFQDILYGFLGPDASGFIVLALVVGGAIFLVRGSDKTSSGSSGGGSHAGGRPPSPPPGP
jgi:hypothetical protein